MKPKQTMLLIFIFIIILISMRCDTNEPPETKASLTLTLEDVSCTEAWIKLTTADLPLPTSFTLMQNDIARATINLTNLIHCCTLIPCYPSKPIHSKLPATSIQYQATKRQLLRLTPPATTLPGKLGHLGRWKQWLYDVAIINENNIWAVGEIYMKDSLVTRRVQCGTLEWK